MGWLLRRHVSRSQRICGTLGILIVAWLLVMLPVGSLGALWQERPLLQQRLSEMQQQELLASEGVAAASFGTVLLHGAGEQVTVIEQLDDQLRVRNTAGVEILLRHDQVMIPEPAWGLFALVPHDYQRAYEGRRFFGPWSH